MSTTYKFNFRGTSGYVTDGANESPVLAEAYPTVYGNGATAGWSTGSPAAADRTTGTGSPELSGMNYWSAGATATFKCDLASGSWDIRLADGDAGSLHGTSNGTITIKDGSTTLATITGINNTATVQYYDATGTPYSAANWGGSNTAITKSVTSGAITFLCDVNGGDYMPICHISLVSAGGGATRGLFRTPSLSGVGVGGSFFRDPLHAPMRIA